MKRFIISIFSLCLGMIGMQAQTLKFNSDKTSSLPMYIGYPEIRLRKKQPSA